MVFPYQTSVLSGRMIAMIGTSTVIATITMAATPRNIRPNFSLPPNQTAIADVLTDMDAELAAWSSGRKRPAPSSRP